MASATLNLLVLDSRRTRQNRILEADLLRDNLKLPLVQFVLNRDGYTPSLFRELLTAVRSINPRRTPRPERELLPL